MRVRYIDTVKNFSIDEAEKQVGKSLFLGQDRVAFERHDVLGDDGQAKCEFGGEVRERLGGFPGACDAAGYFDLLGARVRLAL